MSDHSEVSVAAQCDVRQLSALFERSEFARLGAINEREPQGTSVSRARHRAARKCELLPEKII